MKLTKNVRARMGVAARMVAVMTIAAFGLARAPAAHADPVLLKAATTLVYGSASDTYSVIAPGAGTITASVSSVPWPTPLAALSFNMTSATNLLSPETGAIQAMALDSSSTDPQTETYQVGAGTYFAHVSAAAAGALNLGLYSVMFTFSPSAVPLPASAGLLLIALMVAFGLRRTIRSAASGIEDAGLGVAHN